MPSSSSSRTPTTGPSSSASPYRRRRRSVGLDRSLLTVGDETADGTGWQMVGIPDGLGAFDNGDGTFTVLMNHELGATQGSCATTAPPARSSRS